MSIDLTVESNTLVATEEEAAVENCRAGKFPYRDPKGREPQYTCTVPGSTHRIYMVALGGSGRTASGGNSGGPGRGANLEALIPVIPGEILSIYIGQGSIKGGFRQGFQGLFGYVNGGNGGKAPAPASANGGGGGGSTAVIGSKSGMLIHAGGGGGAGGHAGAFDGGTGGAAGLKPTNGTNGEDDGLGPGGRGGKGGDPKLMNQAGNGGSAESFGGGGGAGGGGHLGGQGGGKGDEIGAGGGGGGGGASFVTSSALAIKENPPGEPQIGLVEFRAAFRANLSSAAFSNVHLRMNAAGVTRQAPAGGQVNCQFGAREFEQCNVHLLPDGLIAIESIQFPGVFLRLDGSQVHQNLAAGSGVVNCQFGMGDLTQFKIVAQPNGVISLESAKFANVFLRLDGNGLSNALPDGGGIVNCQFGAGSWETFRLVAS